MSDQGQFPARIVPDEGRSYSPGTRVRIERTPPFDLVPDPNGDYEVQSCEPALLTGSAGRLRVQLRRVGH